MDFRRVLRIATSNLTLILALTLLGGLSAAGLAFFAPATYVAKTQLFVTASSEGSSTNELAQGATYSSQIANSYVDIVTTGIVLDPVILQLDLDVDSAELAERLHAHTPEGSSLIDLSVEDTDPARAAEIANSVADVLKGLVSEKLERKSLNGQRLVHLTITDVASAPSTPENPKPFLDILSGLVLGLLSGIGLALLRCTLDGRIRSLADVEEATVVPLLGGILDDPTVEENPLTVHVNPASPRAESFRALRTNLRFLNPDNEAGCYVVSSANPGEGKSVISVNLALSLAEAGARVVLVEADLRLPKVHEYLRVESSSGLSDLLVGRADLDDVLERWGRSPLFFLSAGKIPSNPSELLGSNEMKRLISTLRETFDYIIFDAPPILAVTDAAVIGRHTGGALMVVAAGMTKKSELTGAISALDQAGVNVRGIVVTRMTQGDAAGYGYGTYVYSNQTKGAGN